MKDRTFSSSHPSRRRRRRRGTSRLFVIGAAFMASTAVSGKLTPPVYAQGTLRDARLATAPALGSSTIGGVDEGQGTQTATFAIPAGTIGTVADQFRTVAGIRVVFANEAIRDLPSPGVSGAMTAEQALERLLVGTGVGYVFTASDLVTMDIRTAEFVSVSGREAPTVSSPKYTTPLRDVPQTIALIPRATIEEQGATTLSETLRNVPVSRCRPARAAALPTRPATCSTCAASMLRTASSWTACAMTAWCPAMCSTSSRSRSSWDQPDPTWAEARLRAT
jgi:hypothetical protein